MKPQKKITTDLHCHTSFSSDCQVSPEEMLRSAENKSINILAITDHADFAKGDSCVEAEAYIKKLRKLAASSNSVKLLCGIETGIQFEHREKFNQFMKNRDFDFVIGSMHRARELDFFNGEFYFERSAEDCWKTYLEETWKAITSCSNFDVLGHFDIITRYDHLKGQGFPRKFMPLLDKIFSWLIDNDKGIEVNTSGLYYQLDRCHPETVIIERFHDLGGKIVTLGSDAHLAESVGRSMDEGIKTLKNAGFDKLAWFEKRKVQFAEL